MLRCGVLCCCAAALLLLLLLLLNLCLCLSWSVCLCLGLLLMCMLLLLRELVCFMVLLWCGVVWHSVERVVRGTALRRVSRVEWCRALLS